MEHDNLIIGPDDPILITGATGFIGSRVVKNLLDRGFHQLVCFVRSNGDTSRLEAIVSRRRAKARIRVLEGNLLSREDCVTATRSVAVIYHLAAGGGGKSFPDAFMNSVVTTRNLLEASVHDQSLKRFVNISSLAVYSNTGKSR